MAYKKLSNKQVSQLYEKNPEIDDPYYENKKHIGMGATAEAEIFRIKIGKTMYLLHSSPYTGDSWYQKTI